jgi:hypothetical protein
MIFMADKTLTLHGGDHAEKLFREPLEQRLFTESREDFSGP